MYENIKKLTKETKKIKTHRSDVADAGHFHMMWMNELFVRWLKDPYLKVPKKYLNVYYFFNIMSGTLLKSLDLNMVKVATD